MDWFLYDIGLRRERVKYLKSENNFKGKLKETFSPFLKGFQLPEIFSDLRVRL